MQYLGGKSKTRKQIAQYLESVRGSRPYLEPFCGACWITQEMAGERVASDSNVALITMYKALQNGWIPPEHVSEEEYAAYNQKRDEDDPMTAFVGIACSFGGKWFGGYARQKGYDFASGGKRVLLKQLPKLQSVFFASCDYKSYRPIGKLIYCDPPYAGTTGYKDSFDSEDFWNTMRLWAKSNVVVISEYAAPSDFECVLEMPTKTVIRDSSNHPLQTVEKLFMLKEAKNA